jgi:hypothetical protein
MNLRPDIVISDDHRSLLAAGGVWVELPRKFEDIAYIKEECAGCPKETFLQCIQLEIVDRKARCEMRSDAKVFENTAPPPQTGKLYEMFLAKNAPKPAEVVSSEPKPEPKKGLLNRIRNSLVEW